MAAELFDPFEVVREEVQESVGRAEALAASFADPDDPWRQQGPGHGLPQPPERSKLDALLRSLDSGRAPTPSSTCTSSTCSTSAAAC